MRARDERREFFQEFHRREEERLRAVAPRARERAADLSVGEDLETLLAQGRAQEILAQLLDPDAIVRAHGAVGVEVEALEVGVAWAARGNPRGVGIAAEA